MQRFRPVREAAFIAVITRQEVIAYRSPAGSEADRLVMAGQSRLAVLSGAGVVEPALIRQRGPAEAEIIEKTNGLRTGCDTQQIDLPALEAARDQRPMEAPEVWFGERAGPASRCPRRLVQVGQAVQIFVRPVQAVRAIDGDAADRRIIPI